MIYVDELRNYLSKGDWCHMWTDGDESELHEFASKLNMHRNWVHRSSGISGEFVHYDLTPSKRKQAIAKGAQYMPLKDWIKRNHGENQNPLD